VGNLKAEAVDRIISNYALGETASTSHEKQKKAADLRPPHQPPLVPIAQLSLRLRTNPPAQR
jgi:hypothetical protein